ncbi:MAG TPA: hypothetical protein VFK85_06355 [Anaeromyxobacteraceae bacterium]|nr:hypothetical protein [Anaeromyxobacteraceae bacterium]
MTGARRRSAFAIWGSLAAALAGCPLPQPVPTVEGDVSVTPPRILTETVVPADGVVRVAPDCAPEAFVPFSGTLDDPDLDDAVEVRWFVDYSPGMPGVQQNDFPAASPDGTDTRRALPDFRFFPARYAPGPHVVEVVVSNGFYSLGRDPPGSLQPNRTPQPGYETQVFRWLIVYEAGGRCR